MQPPRDPRRDVRRWAYPQLFPDTRRLWPLSHRTIPPRNPHHRDVFRGLHIRLASGASANHHEDHQRPQAELKPAAFAFGRLSLGRLGLHHRIIPDRGLPEQEIPGGETPGTAEISQHRVQCLVFDCTGRATVGQSSSGGVFPSSPRRQYVDHARPKCERGDTRSEPPLVSAASVNLADSLFRPDYRRGRHFARE